MQRNELTSVASINQFLFAGNATVTLESQRTHNRFTYKVRESDDGRKFWVYLLDGPNNESDFTYLGFFTGPEYTHGRKSRITATAPSALAFQWFARMLKANKLHPELKVWHEGRCGACGRKLTVPSSIATGLGPECAEKRGVPMLKCDGFDLKPMGIDYDERAMQRMEAEADRQQTAFEEDLKAAARFEMEQRAKAPARRSRRKAA